MVLVAVIAVASVSVTSLTKIINLFGGPGVGKSTQAALLFGEMKKLGLECELVTEYAKDVVWWEVEAKFKNQLYIFAKQHSRVHRLLGKVDYIITDSPLALSLIYGENESRQFKDLVSHEIASHENVDVELMRCNTYMANGRIHTEEESILIDRQINGYLEREYIFSDDRHLQVKADEKAVENILVSLGLRK